MKRLAIALVTCVASIIVTSCENDSPGSPASDLSPFAKDYLTLKVGTMSSNSMASPTGFTAQANASFDRIANHTTLSFGRIGKDSTLTDTTYYASPWVSCAIISHIVNRDNSVTTIYDYGDGCLEGNEYFKYLMYGKTTYTYLYESEIEGSVYKDHYFGNYSSENYGGEYYYENDTTRWKTNGSSVYSGTSEYDTVNQVYRGSYEYDANDTYSYDDITYTYSGTGRGSYDEEGSIVEKNDYSYTTDEYSYETTVLSPLISRYECYTKLNRGGAELAYCFMPVYVSGKELIRYKQGEKHGSFIIDYGRGECDGKVSITENGNTVDIDLYQVQVF
jgi:hypothetical protein